MKTICQLLAMATVLALAGCAGQQASLVGQCIVIRNPGAAPLGVREYKVVFDTAADANHATKFNVNGGTPLDVPSGIRMVTSGLHTWNFDATSANDTNPPSKTLSIAGGERVVFRVCYH